ERMCLNIVLTSRIFSSTTYREVATQAPFYTEKIKWRRNELSAVGKWIIRLLVERHVNYTFEVVHWFTNTVASVQPRNPSCNFGYILLEQIHIQRLCIFCSF
ncbi:hypothetical protein L9F63_021519, partial [Diploptera punctata]